MPDNQEDVTCEHGTAMDVHCCNCHSGFLFDIMSCTCVTKPTQEDTVDVPIEVRFLMKIPKSLDEKLWQGDTEAFKILENEISQKLQVTKVKIDNMGEHNVILDE